MVVLKVHIVTYKMINQTTYTTLLLNGTKFVHCTTIVIQLCMIIMGKKMKKQDKLFGIANAITKMDKISSVTVTDDFHTMESSDVFTLAYLRNKFLFN